MANFFMDQKGRLLSTVFPAFRGDASVGGPEIVEVTVDLSQIGANNVLSNLGVQSAAPNAGLGLAVGDTIDVMRLPANGVIRNAQILLDTTQVTPNVLPSTPLTAATINIGDAAVSLLDLQTAATPAGYTASATRVASAQSIMTAQNSLLAVTGVLYPRTYYVAPASDYGYMLRIAVASLTGASNIKTGRFRIRLNMDLFANA
jgi:hypothetical protein